MAEDLLPVDHDPFAAVPKPGKTIPPPGNINAARDIASGAAANAMQLPEAQKALRGELTEDEAMHFALSAAAGLIPAAKTEKLAADAVKPLYLPVKNALLNFFSRGGTHDMLHNVVNGMKSGDISNGAKGLNDALRTSQAKSGVAPPAAAAEPVRPSEQSITAEEAIRQARAASGTSPGAPSGSYVASNPQGTGGLGGITYRANPAIASIWAKGGISAPDITELPKNKSEVFKQAIIEAKKANPYGSAVTLHDDYSGMRNFLTTDKKAGFALNGDDIVSLFRHPDSKDQSVTTPLLDLATSQGGRRLDAFDTVLPHLYARNGFKAVGRLSFDPNQQPPDWNDKTFDAYNHGHPDVVGMVYKDNAPRIYSPIDGPRVHTFDELTQHQRGALMPQLDEAGIAAAMRAAASSPAGLAAAHDFESGWRPNELLNLED